MSHVAKQHTNTFWLPENPRRGQNVHLCQHLLPKGWAERKNEIATELRPYWNARGELTVDKNSLLLYQNELLFQSHSRETLEKIHSGYQGVQRCRLWANTAVWWPGLSHEVENMVQQCHTCAQNATPQQQHMIPTKLHTRLFMAKDWYRPFGWACALRWVSGSLGYKRDSLVP